MSNKQFLRLSLLASLSSVALTPALAQQPQDAAAPSSSAIEDIVVVARKVAENVQTTPVAVSALSAKNLADQQIVNIQQIQATAPNLTFSSAVAQPGSSTVFIRGQGSSDGLIAIDQAVGVYIDGVYAARSTGGATDLIDVERVEVLRGPQGTLFGRNTTGGAINIIAAKPTDVFEGSVRVDYGNYDSKLFQAVLNVPLTPGLAVRGAYQHRDHDGYGRAILQNKPLGDMRSDFGRISVNVEPEGEKWSVLLSADISRFKNSGELTVLKSYSGGTSPYNPTELLAAACGTQPIPPGLPAATAGFLGGLKSGAIPLCPNVGGTPGPIGNYVYGQNGNNDFYGSFGNTPSYGISNTSGGSGVVKYDFSEAALLKSTTAWRGVFLESRSDNDGSPYTLSGGLPPIYGNQITQNQFSQELQLSGKLGPVDYILGGFYFVENGTDRSNSGSLFPLSPSRAVVDGTVRNKSTAGYGQLIYHVTDAIRLTAGGRYTSDERSLISRNRDENQLTGVVTSSLGGLVDNPAVDKFTATFKRKYHYWSYLFSADWEVSKGLFLYAKTSRSQRSGGLNTRAVDGGIPPVGFNPEVVTDYEAGAKLELLDRRVRLNLAAFNSDVGNVQRNIVGTAAGNRLVSGVDNAAKARIRGLEAELTVAPAQGLTFNANAGLTDAKYKNFINSIDGSDWTQSKFPYTPKWTIGIGGDYKKDVGPGTLKLHVDYGWRSEQYTAPIAISAAARVGKTADQIAAASNALQATALIPSYDLLNGRIAFQLKEPNIELAFFGRNITAKKYFTRLLAVENTPLGFTSYTPGDPRTYGVSASFKF